MANENNNTPANVTMGNTEAELRAELDRYKKENDLLKANALKKVGTFAMKVSEKGVVSIYGLGRFPCNLYPEQWDTLIGSGDTIDGVVDQGKVPEIRAFIKAKRADGTIKMDAEALKASKAAAQARTVEALSKLPQKKR